MHLVKILATQFQNLHRAAEHHSHFHVSITRKKSEVKCKASKLLRLEHLYVSPYCVSLTTLCSSLVCSAKIFSLRSGNYGVLQLNENWTTTNNSNNGWYISNSIGSLLLQPTTSTLLTGRPKKKVVDFMSNKELNDMGY